VITRRDFMIGTAVSAGCLAASAGSLSDTNLAPGQNPCSERMADPPWKHLSSANGDLPVPELSDQQTGSMVGDIDGDGRMDFVFTGREKSNAAIWMRNTGRANARYHGWQQYVIDPGPRNLEAGGTLFDVDGDGHLDMVNGGDASTNEVWWWENPYPHYEAGHPWKRHVIKDSGKTQHHDMMFGDVLGAGRPQLVFWNQGAMALFLAQIPESPRERTTPWDLHIIYQTDAPMEGMAMADIDRDGVVEIVGGGRWFKHDGNLRFTAHLIDDRQKFSRAGAGKLITSAPTAQVLFDSGDGCGPFNWYEGEASGKWVPHDLLGEEVVHGHTLRVGDVDRDGHLDIFCAEMAKWCDWTRTVDYPRARLWVFYGDGKGNFEKVTIARGGHGTHEAQLVDLNGDGKLDILGKPYMAGAPGVDMWLNPGTRRSKRRLRL
jgi:FG-GAP-like repeat